MSARPGPCGGRSAMIVPTAISLTLVPGEQTAQASENARLYQSAIIARGQPLALEIELRMLSFGDLRAFEAGFHLFFKPARVSNLAQYRHCERGILFLVN